MTKSVKRQWPKRDMGSRWKKLSLVTTEHTANWVAFEAKTRGMSMAAFMDDVLTKAKWSSRQDKN